MKQHRAPHPQRGPLPGQWTLLGCCLALGAASGLCGWLVMSRASDFGPLAGYLPGAVLGVGVFVGGQLALSWPSQGLARACFVVVVSSLLAWRLALWTRELGGPGSWVMASLAGTAGVAAGILLAWPQARRKPLLGALAATAIAGGLLFTAAYELRLHSAARSTGRWWPLLLICLWQASLVATAALALRLTNDTSRP